MTRNEAVLYICIICAIYDHWCWAWMKTVPTESRAFVFFDRRARGNKMYPRVFTVTHIDKPVR